jgi:hypothetical protein
MIFSENRFPLFRIMRGAAANLFPVRQCDGDVRRGADDPRAAVGVGLAPDQRFQNQKKFFGKHGATSLSPSLIESKWMTLNSIT